MRLFQRGRVTVSCRNQEISAAARPLSGTLYARRYGEYVQDMVRLLLPWNAQIQPGDRVLLKSAPYICVSVRAFPGHVQADVRRCSR